MGPRFKYMTAQIIEQIDSKELLEVAKQALIRTHLCQFLQQPATGDYTGACQLGHCPYHKSYLIPNRPNLILHMCYQSLRCLATISLRVRR
jgi:hypothetical protein